MVNKYLIGAVLFALSLAGSGYGGWAARGWRDDSRTLVSERTERAAEQETIRRFNEATEKSLAALQAAQKNRREVIREVVKLQYRDRECLGIDGVRLVNAAAQDIAATPALNTLPGQPAATD